MQLDLYLAVTPFSMTLAGSPCYTKLDREQGTGDRFWPINWSSRPASLIYFPCLFCTGHSLASDKMCSVGSSHFPRLTGPNHMFLLPVLPSQVGHSCFPVHGQDTSGGAEDPEEGIVMESKTRASKQKQQLSKVASEVQSPDQ